MSLLVLAYPDISKNDYNRIQKFRKEYDSRYFKIVKPHFTVVFPVNSVKESFFITHIETLSKKSKQINFTLECSVIIKDLFSDFTDIFLIPDEGNSEIIRLHDKVLYRRLNFRIKIGYSVHPTHNSSPSP